MDPDLIGCAPDPAVAFLVAPLALVVLALLAEVWRANRKIRRLEADQLRMIREQGDSAAASLEEYHDWFRRHRGGVDPQGAFLDPPPHTKETARQFVDRILRQIRGDDDIHTG